VSTGENGVDNGRLPGGLMGISFDTDAQAIEGATGEPSDYEVPALDPMNDPRSTEEVTEETREEVENDGITSEEFVGNSAQMVNAQRHMELAQTIIRDNNDEQE
jgi:hypothetical protein